MLAFASCVAGPFALGFPAPALGLSRSNVTVTAAVIALCVALGAIRELVANRRGRRRALSPKYESRAVARLRIVHRA